jgi:hypothetical protein
MSSVVPAEWNGNTGLAQRPHIGHLKFVAEKFFTAWLDLTDPTRQVEALTEYFVDMPVANMPQNPSAQPSTTTPALNIARRLSSPAAFQEFRIAASPTIQSLKEEFDRYRSITFLGVHDSALAWACSQESNSLPRIRRLILHLHPTPVGSTSAEQVFSVLSFHVDSWNTTLDEFDLESRLVLAFNCRYLSALDRARVFGWSEYWHLFKSKEMAVALLEQANSVPIGAAHRRTTEPARAAKAAKRLSASPLVSGSQPSSSTSQSPSPTPRAPAKKKRGRPPKTMPVDLHDSDDDLEETWMPASKISHPPGQEPDPDLNNWRAIFSSSLLYLQESFEQDPRQLRNGLQQSLKNSTLSASARSSLLNLIAKIDDASLSKFVASLARNVKEGVKSDDLVTLLSVEFRIQSPQLAAASMNIEDCVELPPQSATSSPIGNLIEAAFAAASGPNTSDDPVMAAVLLKSWLEWLEQNQRFLEEIKTVSGRLRQHGLLLRNVPSDGNCLYHCIALALVHFQPGDFVNFGHVQVRADLVAYMKKRKKDWFPQLDKKETLKKFCDDQAKSGTWGDKNVVKAAAERYGIILHVYNGWDDDVVVYTPVKFNDETPVAMLFLIGFRHFMFASPSYADGM